MLTEAWDKLIGNDVEVHIEQEIKKVSIDKIRQNPFQPRKVFDHEKIKELAQSIKTYGLLQPIILRKKSGIFQIVAGERRYLACKSLGWTAIAAVIRDLSDGAMATIALIENLQRENLHFLEEAQGYQKLMQDFKLTQEVAAQRLGKSQSTIANKIRLLKLPETIKQKLLADDLTERHARALLRIPSEETQKRVANEISNLGLTVKQTEKRINDLLGNTPGLEEKKDRRKVIIRDVRIFLNTIRQAVSILEQGGLGPKVYEEDCGDYLKLTIHVPKNKSLK